jgi:hypothetical protein
MIPYQSRELVLMISSSLAVLGIISIMAGILLLVLRSGGKAVHSIANQAARLAQKGLAEDVAGLVGNASALVEAVTNLVRTNAGIGIFLVVFGFVMLLSAYFFASA